MNAQSPPPLKSRSSGRGCWISLLLLFLIGSVGLNALLLMALVMPDSSATRLATKTPRFEEQTYRSPQRGVDTKIAIINLDGIISSGVRGNVGETMIDDVRLALRQAVRDDSVRAILLQVNSPGGEVTASDMLYHYIREAAEEKPVVAYIGSVGASGAYYAICGASHLMSNQLSLTGSVGVIIQTLNYEDLFGKIGLRSVTFKSGELKDLLDGSRPVTDAERDLLQSLVMQSFDRFREVVLENRPESVPNRFLDGRILSGADAVEVGLLDQTGYFEDAIRKAEELGGAPGAEVVRYRAPFRLGRLLPFLSESPRVEVSLLPSQPEGVRPGQLYFLPGFWLQ